MKGRGPGGSDGLPEEEEAFCGEFAHECESTVYLCGGKLPGCCFVGEGGVGNWSHEFVEDAARLTLFAHVQGNQGDGPEFCGPGFEVLEGIVVFEGAGDADEFHDVAMLGSFVVEGNPVLVAPG